MWLKDDGVDRLLILPLLHHSTDVDGDEFKIGRQFVAVSRYPHCLIAEFNEAALDDAGTLRLVVAFDAVFPTGKIIDAGQVFLHNVTHD